MIRNNVRESEAVFRSNSNNDNNNIHTMATMKKRSTAAFLVDRAGNTSRKTRIMLAMLGLLLCIIAVQRSYATETKEIVSAASFFVEKETKVVAPLDPSPKYRRNANCPAQSDSLLHNTTVSAWALKGQEIFKSIKDRSTANGGLGGIWSDHFGFSKHAAISNHGHRIAMAYEGEAGIDKAFGLHIDIMVLDEALGQWVLEQTISDVTRHHGHDTRVTFQSLAMSADGNRIAFADGHGVSVFFYDRYSSPSWQVLANVADPVLLEADDTDDDKISTTTAAAAKRQFGTNLAFNCDGTTLAISSKSSTASTTYVYQETYNPHSKVHAWAPIGEIHGVKFGGSIALNGEGTRLAIGTVASENWKGIVQVWDRSITSSSYWTRVGQPIVGSKLQEQWGGKVTMNTDGSMLLVSSSNGAANRVQAYRLSLAQPQQWEPYANELTGSDNVHEFFGSDIAINHDGTVLAVGAPGDHDLFVEQEKLNKIVPAKNRPYLSGRIYVYRLDIEMEQWIRVDQGEIVSTVEGDLYGYAVSLDASGTRLLAGAPLRTGKGYQHILGSVRVNEVQW